MLLRGCVGRVYKVEWKQHCVGQVGQVINFIAKGNGPLFFEQMLRLRRVTEGTNRGTGLRRCGKAD